MVWIGFETAALRRVCVGVLTAVAIAFGGSTTAVASASAGMQPQVRWIDLFGVARVQPRAIFFTANSGSQVVRIKWSGWGRAKAVGRGHYRITSPPPPGTKNPSGPARIVAFKPRACVPSFGSHHGRQIRVYRRAKMLRPVPSGGRKWVDISAYTGADICR